MHTEWTDRLSDYLDEELSVDERRAVEAHLVGCAECRAVLDELTHVVARARRLEPRPPGADLWPGVQRRIDRVSARRFAVTLPQAIAASLVIALLSGAVVWLATGSPKGLRYGTDPSAPGTSGAAAAAAPAPRGFSSASGTPSADVATVSFADAQYDAAVSDLEKALKGGRGRLDKTTIEIVEHNLQIIDQAIDQARQALDADPANSYLSSHLVRRAAALTESD